MTKKIPLYAVILTVAFAVLITFQVTYIAFWQSFRQDELDSRPDDDFAAIEEKLKLIYDIYGENYIGQLDPEELETGVMLGLVYGTGDRYGEYMDPETYAEFTSEVAGDTEGIGIMITKSLDTGLIEIVDVIPDSPASEADLRVGDLICRVTGEEVAEVGYYAAIDMMLGKAGTTAEFTVYRDGEYIDFSIERRHVEQVNVNYRMYEDGITGIIRISSFDEVTAAQFKNAVADLQKQVRSLIDGADFSLLYDERKKLFRIGLNTAEDHPGEGCYDLFMSEARTTSYFAIATGQVPRDHWNRLGRILIGREGCRKTAALFVPCEGEEDGTAPESDPPCSHRI